MNASLSPISSQHELKPFLVIHTYGQPRKRFQRRVKRHSNCSGSGNECCKESLYVSFEEIGWDDWILHPKGYNAYFCRGSCAVAASVTLSGSHHNTVMQVSHIQQRSQTLSKKGVKKQRLLPNTALRIKGGKLPLVTSTFLYNFFKIGFVFYK